VSIVDGECIHGLGPVSACVICNGREADDARRARIVSIRFRARYASVIDCHHFVGVGSWVARMADGSLICEECAP
jgi:hypothetical protein